MMAMYLDVSALRIQQYLVRYPRLRAITAASAMLSDETRWDAVASVADGLAHPNPAAGDVDGKISLIVESEDVEKLARDVIGHLLRRLPAARFEAHWAQADSYPQALVGMREQRGSRTGIVTAPPVSSLPFCRLCDRCAESPATVHVQDIDGRQWSCEDCAYRVPDLVSGGRRRGTTVLEGYRLPDDFNELARLGVDRKRNHLATIYADGNSLGKFFKDAVEVCTADQLNDLSTAVTRATERALVTAAEAIQPDGEQVVATVAHIVGGDDVLVTVPASFGWKFAMTYLSTFSETMQQVLDQDAFTSVGLTAPTASAGVVFSHKSFPFAAVFELSGSVLSRAKTGAPTVSQGRVSGQKQEQRPATINWVDITSDGPHLPQFRQPISLETLQTRTTVIDELARVPASARSNIERYLNNSNPFVGSARVRKLQRRLQFSGLEPFVVDLPSIPRKEPIARDVREASAKVHHLRNYLSLTNWWTV